MITAKFYVTERTEVAGGNFRIKMVPVLSGDGDDEKFWKYTPSGSLVMELVVPDTAGKFKPGQRFYLDFTPTDKP